MPAVRVDPRPVQDAIRRFGRDAEFASVVALTRTAKAAQQALKADLPVTFDKPTPFTMRSTYVRPATKADPVAFVGFREFAGKGTPATKYLMPQVAGGARRPKRFERALQAAGILPKGWYAVPGDSADLDGYGNMNRGQISKILSALRASPDATQNRSASGKSRGRRRREQYFTAKPGSALPPGIYKRGGPGNRDALPIVFFTRRAPQYTKRYRFNAIIARTVAQRFGIEFDIALAQTVGRSLRRRAA